MTPNDIVLTGRNTLEKEARALADYVHRLDENFSKACETIVKCSGTTLLTGMGKSGLVARKWSSTFSSTGTKSYFLNPAEASHGDLGIMHSRDVLVALSYSGETEELTSVLRHAGDMGIPRIAITGNPRSTLAAKADVVLDVFTREEACPLNLAPTTSTTVMMALGDALAVTLMSMRGFTEKDFARLHPGGSLGRRLWLRVTDLMHSGEAIPEVRPDDSWEKVLLVMTEKRLGLAVVMESGRPIGLVTDGDLRRFLQRSKFSDSVMASTLMTTKPKSISVDALGIEAREILESNAIQHLLVTHADGTLAGVVHFHDLLRRKVL